VPFKIFSKQAVISEQTI